MSTNLGLDLRQRAGLSPAVEAYVEPSTDLRLNYRELNEFTNRCASVLGALDLKAGDRVALLLMNGVNAATYSISFVADSDLVFGVSNLILIAAFVVVLGYIGMHMSVFGRHTLAIGSSEEAATIFCQSARWRSRCTGAWPPTSGSRGCGARAPSSTASR